MKEKSIVNKPMKLKPGYGINHLVFGNTEQDVKELLGEPDKVFTNQDDENELIYQYNRSKLLLTFYQEENGKLGYIRCANPKLTFNSRTILYNPLDYVISDVFGEIIKDWEIEHYTYFDTYFNEELWLTLVVAFNEVTEIELGVSFKTPQEYDWKV